MGPLSNDNKPLFAVGDEVLLNYPEGKDEAWCRAAYTMTDFMKERIGTTAVISVVCDYGANSKHGMFSYYIEDSTCYWCEPLLHPTEAKERPVYAMSFEELIGEI